jgi:CheY-like chemotaxis protein
MHRRPSPIALLVFTALLAAPAVGRAEGFDAQTLRLAPVGRGMLTIDGVDDDDDDGDGFTDEEELVWGTDSLDPDDAPVPTGGACRAAPGWGWGAAAWLLALVVVGAALRRRGGGSGPARVLVVTSAEGEGVVIAESLGAEWSCSLAASAAEALGVILQDDGWDVILCELALTDARGTDLLRAIRPLRAGLAERIVFLGGGDTAGEAEDEAVIATLANWVLYRPFDAETLRSTLRQRLGSDTPQTPEAP